LPTDGQGGIGYQLKDRILGAGQSIAAVERVTWRAAPHWT
jgi:hypothetical protein